MKPANDKSLAAGPRSRHPRYSFENGLIQLEVDEYKGMARLINNEGRLGESRRTLALLSRQWNANTRGCLAARSMGRSF